MRRRMKCWTCPSRSAPVHETSAGNPRDGSQPGLAGGIVEVTCTQLNTQSFPVKVRRSCANHRMTSEPIVTLHRLMLLVAGTAVISAIHGARAQTPFKALVFSKTAEFRHASITNGIATIQQLGATNNFTVDATEDGAAFNDANLAQYKVVIFLSTTGDVLDTNQQSAFTRFIQAGGGYAGIHAAADTERDWPWYGQLVGIWQSNHPPGTASATVKVTDHVHPSTKNLPERWVRTD